MSRKTRSHLSVVWNKDTAKATARRKPIQLDLPIGRDEYRVAFVGEGDLTGSFMLATLQSLQPNYLIDLRTCPRLDLPGYSRQKAFADFDRWGARYFCLSSQDAAADLHERVARVFEMLEPQVRGPLLVIVDRDDAVDQFSERLMKVLAPPSNKKKAKSAQPIWKFSVTGLGVIAAQADPAQRQTVERSKPAERRLALVSD